jgi:hypothetical protein
MSKGALTSPNRAEAGIPTCNDAASMQQIARQANVLEMSRPSDPAGEFRISSVLRSARASRFRSLMR